MLRVPPRIMSGSASPKVAIIGAGPGGLASALLLAKSGVDVTVFERSSSVGGRNKVFDKDGFKFDLGPTFFHYPEVIEDIFKAIGMDAHEELKLHRLDMNYRLIFGQGGQLDCTSDLDEMTERIRGLSGDSNANAFRRYVVDNRVKLNKSKACLQEPWYGPTDLLSKRAMRVAGVLRPQRSVAGDLMKLFDDDRLMLAMSFQTKYLGMSPFNCPSLFTMLAFLEYEYGIFHPIGGLGSVSERMANIAKDLGVTFRMNEAVESVIMDGKTIKGVRTAEGEFLADKVVMNADFANGMTQLFPDTVRKKWSNKKIDKKKYSCSTFMLYLGVDRTYDELPHHQIYASANYEKNLEDIEKNHQITWDDPSVYVQNACVTWTPVLRPKDVPRFTLWSPFLTFMKTLTGKRKRMPTETVFLTKSKRNLASKTSESTSSRKWSSPLKTGETIATEGRCSTLLTAWTKCSGADQRTNLTKSTTSTSSVEAPIQAADCP